MKKWFPGLLISLTIQAATAQTGDAILQFTAFQSGNHIQLDFTLSAGTTCNGIQIYRSEDSLNFSEIGDIQGICGSADRNETYSFNDNSPLKNKVNYYRLQLGTLGFSSVISQFFIDVSGNKALVFPNPVTDQSTIYFLNNSNSELQLFVYDSDRKLVKKSESTRTKSFQLDRRDYKAGVYFFEIKSDGFRRYHGKFVVQ